MPSEAFTSIKYIDPAHVQIEAVREDGSGGSGIPETVLGPNWESYTIDPYEPPAPTAADVKAEAERRILIHMPEYEQRNYSNESTEMIVTYGTDTNNWPEEYRDHFNERVGKWVNVKAIRAASNDLEAMDPIPIDYADDQYWPDVPGTERPPPSRPPIRPNGNGNGNGRRRK